MCLFVLQEREFFTLVFTFVFNLFDVFVCTSREGRLHLDIHAFDDTCGFALDNWDFQRVGPVILFVPEIICFWIIWFLGWFVNLFLPNIPPLWSPRTYCRPQGQKYWFWQRIKITLFVRTAVHSGLNTKMFKSTLKMDRNDLAPAIANHDPLCAHDACKLPLRLKTNQMVKSKFDRSTW